MRESTREALKAITSQLHNDHISESDLEAAMKKGQEDREAIERYEKAKAEKEAKQRYIARNGISGSSLRESEEVKSLLKAFTDQAERNQETGRQIINGVNEYIEKQKREDKFDELLGSANQKLEAAWSRYEEAAAAHDTEKALEARQDVKKYSDEAVFYKAQIEG